MLGAWWPPYNDHGGDVAAKFVRDKLYDQSTGTLLRRFRDGEARFEGTLDDYAFLIR